MSSITFSGLASGLDTGKLIDQLVAAERASADALTRKQSDLSAQKSILGSLSTALAALGTAARGMDLASELTPQTATVSDARLAVAVSASAASGSHDIRVKQLAAAKVTSSRTFATAGPGTLGDGGVNITVGGVTKSVSWTAADSLDAVAARITGAGAGVSASVLFDGTNHRLVVTANATGTAAAPTFADTGASTLALADPANVKVAARDAIVTVDSIDITRSRNVIDDALTGVTLTLNSVPAASDPDTKVAIGLDTKGLRDKVKAMVDAYNAVNSALHVQLDFTGTTKGSNTLFGDTTLRQLQGSLGAAMTAEYGGTSLGALGVSRDRTGAMTLDEARLTAALAADPGAVADLFVTGGFATALTTLTDSYTQAATGLLASKTQSLTDRSTALQQQIDRINSNADALGARLAKQFGALEQAMSLLQNQSAQLAAILR